LDHDVLDGANWHFTHYRGNPKVRESFNVLTRGEIIEVIPGVYKWGATRVVSQDIQKARGTILGFAAAAEAIEAFAELTDDLKATAVQSRTQEDLDG
jgi:hypothetical protein